MPSARPMPSRSMFWAHRAAAPVRWCETCASPRRAGQGCRKGGANLRGPLSPPAPQILKECAQILDEQIGLLHSREMTAPGHAPVVHDVEGPVEPGTRISKHLARIDRDPGRNLDAGPRRAEVIDELSLGIKSHR